jgi:long-chain acyl-CoA synthetase
MACGLFIDILAVFAQTRAAMLLHQFFEDTVERLPDKQALVVDGRRFTYGELAEQVDVLVAALQACGVGRGDRVALFLDNHVEMVCAVFAALKLGAVFMPINPLTKADKLAYLLNDSRAAALLTQGSLAGPYGAALALSPDVRVVWVVAAKAGLEDQDARVRPWPTASGAALPSQQTIDQDLAAIIYTSGSTGDAKGVMLTHLNMVSACTSVSTYLGLRESDVISCALPLAFDYGLYQLLMSVKVGATLVLERSFAFPVQVLKNLVHERVTVFPGVPTMFTMMMNLKTLPDFDLSALRMVTNTAAALSESHIQKLRALFPQASLFSMYGLTECKRVTYLPPEQLDIRPTSVGRGMPNEEVWLVDDDGQRLPNGRTGELVIRGSNVMRGYWRKPEQTAERLKPGPLPGEMVLYSGDLFRTDSEGFLYFVARKDDIIKSRGEKVSPREVENVLHKLEAVYEVAVVGVPDELLGEAVKAFVVLKPGAVCTERDVLRHCMAHLESFMVPKQVVFVDALPRTDTGKIKKTGLA